IPLLTEPESLSRAMVRTTARTPMRSYRIAVVDDTRSAGFVLGKLLEKLGQQVSVYSNPVEALRAIPQDRPAVVISDIGMPQIDGYELARQLRRLPGFDSVVLVALTGYGQESDRQRALEAGFDQHLVKPVSIEAIEALLTQLHQRESSP